jgi:hypothetical protein
MTNDEIRMTKHDTLGWHAQSGAMGVAFRPAPPARMNFPPALPRVASW